MSNEGKQNSRRSFLNYLIGLGVIGFGLHLLRSFAMYLWPPKAITEKGRGGENVVLKLNDIPANGSKKILLKGEPYIVVRKNSHVYAMSARCTHLGCLVNYEPDTGEVICPCHGARFALNGSVIGGPAPKALKEARVKVKDGTVEIG